MSRITSMDVFRRAREAAQAVEAAREEEEIWVLPPGPVTKEQVDRVLRLIDTKGENS